MQTASWRFAPPLSGLGFMSMICALWTASPGFAADRPPIRPETPPFFNADVAVLLDSTAQTAVVVSITVPYSELQWVQFEDGYAAAAAFSFAIEPGRGGRTYGDAWEQRIALDDFGPTNSTTRVMTERRHFHVPPGRYRVRVGLRDLSAGRQSQATQQLEVRDYSDDPIGFADIELGVADSSGFQPVPTRLYGLNVESLAARVVLFDRRPGGWPRTYPFHYRILDETGSEIVAGTQEVTLARSAEPAIVKPARSDLFLGTYTFQLQLAEGRERWTAERTFDVEESGPPHGREFDRMLEPLSYIADPSEIEELRALPEADQADGWNAFWRRRDPTPGTPRNEVQLEFFRRVRYAERNFQGFGPGWRSDMGRIYIQHGPPDQIESRPATAASPQLEIWYYNGPYRRYVFADREGFGRYVLLNPNAQ